jgi:perosamine synthetase
MNNKRRRIVAKYNEAFKDLEIFKIPVEKDYVKCAYWLYILRLEKGNRDEFMQYLLDNEVLANTSFKPLHLFSFYKDYYEKQGIKVECPVAEQEWNKLVVLPLYPDMSDEEINKVIEVVKNFKEKQTENES